MLSHYETPQKSLALSAYMVVFFSHCVRHFPVIIAKIVGSVSRWDMTSIKEINFTVMLTPEDKYRHTHVRFK